MSETETREPMCTCGHARIDHIHEEGACRPGFVCWASCERFDDRQRQVPPPSAGWAWMDAEAESSAAAIQRYAPATAEWLTAVARAESDRLRGVVEAVQALADDMEAQAAESTPVMGEVWTVAAREVRRALAPVSSSGEWANAYADPDQAHDSISPTVTSSRQPMRDPAPSSGEAQSGEGRDPWRLSLESAARLIAAASWPGEAPDRRDEWAPKMLTDVEMRTREVARARRRFESAVAAIGGTARPVLSREALRARLDGHWPSATGCHCGWWVPKTARTQGPWRDHLADVLAGGEQA